MAYRRIAPQLVQHSEGYQVFVVDRQHVGYRDGAAEAHVEVDLGATVTIYADSIVVTSGDPDSVPGDVVARLVAGIEAMGATVTVERPANAIE